MSSPTDTSESNQMATQAAAAIVAKSLSHSRSCPSAATSTTTNRKSTTKLPTAKVGSSSAKFTVDQTMKSSRGTLDFKNDGKSPASSTESTAMLTNQSATLASSSSSSSTPPSSSSSSSSAPSSSSSSDPTRAEIMQFVANLSPTSATSLMHSLSSVSSPPPPRRAPARRGQRTSNRPPSRGRSTGGKTMEPGVPHPDAGQVLGPNSQRCECGGITGICGTAQGARKWRSHMRSTKHMTWEFN